MGREEKDPSCTELTGTIRSLQSPHLKANPNLINSQMFLSAFLIVGKDKG